MLVESKSLKKALCLGRLLGFTRLLARPGLTKLFHLKMLNACKMQCCNILGMFQASSSASTFVDSSKFAAKTEKRSELKHDRKIPAETRKKEKGEKEVFGKFIGS